MNRGFFFTEGHNILDNLKMKEILSEYDAPPWSPNIEMLSPIKKLDTAFCGEFEKCTEMDTFSDSKLEFRSPESIDEEKATKEIEATETPVKKVSLPPTPKVRKPISLILSRVRKIDFDLPEDYELPVKSKTIVDNYEDEVNETVV